MEIYNSSINIMGSIPDYASMIDFIVEEHHREQANGTAFRFRTEKSLNRFAFAIDDSVLRFPSKQAEDAFYDILVSQDSSANDKLMVVFWQMTYANALFRKVTAEVFMKAVYQGRTSLTIDDVLSYIRHLKEECPESITWSDKTIRTVASKYLTIMKKLNLADGKQRKEIRYPSIDNRLFVYFVRWAIGAAPEDRTLDNPFMLFGFADRETLISRLKRIENIAQWDITQIGDNITIDLK